MQTTDRIVGSAEPLTPEQTEARIRELEEWGVDRSLTWANLQMTPTQRLVAMLRVLEFTNKLRRAWDEQRLVESTPITQQNLVLVAVAKWECGTCAYG